MNLTFSVAGGEFRSLKLDATIANFEKNLKAGITASVIMVEGDIKKNELTGQILNVRSGALRRSITHRVTRLPGGWQGQVGTNLIYAPVHEFGATIRAKHSAYLRFKAGGSWHSVREVTIPARPFMRPALENNIGAIIATIKAHVGRHL